MTDHDVVVIGAGFSGLYAIHKFRDQLGLSVRAFEAAEGVGGTWWWNRYPGARCDIESAHYSYSFSDELQREWHWSERYAGQSEILSYLEWVADRLDLRRSLQLGTRVTSLDWEEEHAHWVVGTDDGKTCTARFVLSGVGGLSHPKTPEFGGLDSFEGELLWTSNWPARRVDLTGKRVAVVGTGSSGIQVVQEIADQVGHLFVFQRTPNFATPLANKPHDAEYSRWLAENWSAVRGNARETIAGVPYPQATMPAFAVDADERRAAYEKAYEDGGLHLVLSTFTDLMWNEDANRTVADYVRDKIRERVSDPAKAELLLPTDHPYGTKRPPFEIGYYEAFNLPHVELVDARSAPIESVTPTGIKTTEASYDVDVIILATGFDAFTGASLAIPTTGRDGITLQERWSEGPRNYLGMQSCGFPNMFTVIGPLNVASQYNTPLLIEDQVDFAAQAVEAVTARGARSIDATPEAEQRWVDLVNGIFSMSLWAKAQNSWFRGGNIEGKPNTAYILPTGAPLYRAMLLQSAFSGLAGFAIDGQPTELPPLVRLDPAAALTVAVMMNSGAPPLENCTLEELRALVENTSHMALPGPDVRTEDVEDPCVRVYIPGSDQQERPVVVFLHGGGFAAGSVDAADPICRALSGRLDTIVVSVDYRLAPEHPCPAAPEDALAAVRWAREHIATYGGDPERIALLGESAGANIAAVTALAARDEGIPLAAQVLLYPPIDPESNTASLQEFAHGPFLTAAAAAKFWQMYLGDQPATWQAAPIRAGSLAGVAPALVVSGEIDVLRDEVESYAEALRAAGVEVDVCRVAGLFHGTFMMTALIPRAQEMHDAVTHYLASQLVAPAPAAT